MLKTCMTLALTFIFLFTVSSTEGKAATKKKKYVSHSSKSGKKKSSKRYKSRRHTSSVDLKALTTESPYTENSDNGINPVETKPGIH